MHKLLDFFTLTYYIPPLLLIISTGSLLIGYLKRNSFKSLRFLPIYAGAASIQIVTTFICIVYRNFMYAQEINNYSLFLFVIIEFAIFYNLILQLLKSTYLKASLYSITILFIAFCIYSWAKIDFSTYIPGFFYITDSICLTIPCLFYFYEIFTATPIINLSNQPSFWIVIGFSFLAICTLPFYLLEHYLYENFRDFYDRACILNYVFYCLLFFLISKAFLCTPETDK